MVTASGDGDWWTPHPHEQVHHDAWENLAVGCPVDTRRVVLRSLLCRANVMPLCFLDIERVVHTEFGVTVLHVT